MTSIIFCIDLLPLNNTTPIKGLAQEYFYPLSILLNIEYLLCFVKVDTFGLSQIKRKPTNKIKKRTWQNVFHYNLGIILLNIFSFHLIF